MMFVRRGVWLLVVLSASTSASAQYQCRSGNTFFQSSRPCVAAAPPAPSAPVTPVTPVTPVSAQQPRDDREPRGATRRTERHQRDTVSLESEQCHEAQRILQSKRQRLATMNEGEKADLARFEDAHHARCKS